MFRWVEERCPSNVVTLGSMAVAASDSLAVAADSLAATAAVAAVAAVAAAVAASADADAVGVVVAAAVIRLLLEYGPSNQAS